MFHIFSCIFYIVTVPQDYALCLTIFRRVHREHIYIEYLHTILSDYVCLNRYYSVFQVVNIYKNFYIVKLSVLTFHNFQILPIERTLS